MIYEDRVDFTNKSLLVLLNLLLVYLQIKILSINTFLFLKKTQE